MNTDEDTLTAIDTAFLKAVHAYDHAQTRREKFYELQETIRKSSDEIAEEGLEKARVAMGEPIRPLTTPYHKARTVLKQAASESTQAGALQLVKEAELGYHDAQAEYSEVVKTALLSHLDSCIREYDMAATLLKDSWEQLAMCSIYMETNLHMDTHLPHDFRTNIRVPNASPRHAALVDGSRAPEFAWDIESFLSREGVAMLEGNYPAPKVYAGLTQHEQFLNGGSQQLTEI
jgi:hypothetical protein